MSRSNYYRPRAKTNSEKTAEEIAVINCFEKHHGNYGRIRIRKELLNEDLNISEYRIGGILKKYGLVSKAGRKRQYRKRKPTEQQYYEENLIQDKFSVKTANYLWCSDITELVCKGGKLYVCGVIDVATRRIVGWSIAKQQTQILVQDAFRMAKGKNPIIPDGAVYHSDRGSQYTAKRTKQLIEKNGFRKSMSRPGTPSDNQPIESFWHTLETELGSLKDYNYSDASRKIVDYIELYYNAARLHSGIAYLVPNDFLTLLSVHKT